jgi:hypothetical protein
MKFKLGFTVQAETLLMMMSKFLPIEDLHVEEILDTPIKQQSVVAKLIEKAKIDKPKDPRRVMFKHESGKSLKDFILEYISQTPKHLATWNEMSKYSVTLGYNKSSINNAVARLEKEGKIHRTAPGKYRLIEAKKTA